MGLISRVSSRTYRRSNVPTEVSDTLTRLLAMLDRLPIELFLKICGYLDENALTQTSNACPTFRQLLEPKLLKIGALGFFTNGVCRKSIQKQECTVQASRRAYSKVLQRWVLRVDGLQRGMIITQNFDNFARRKMRCRFRVISCDPMRASFRVWVGDKFAWQERVHIHTFWHFIESRIVTDDDVINIRLRGVR